MDKDIILANLKNLLEDPNQCDPSWQDLRNLMERLIEEYFKKNFTSCKVKTTEFEDYYFYDGQTICGVSSILKKIGITGVKVWSYSSEGFVSISTEEKKF